MKHPIRTPREFVSNIVVVDSQPQDYETLIARASDWSYQFQVFTSGSQAMQASLALFDGLWLINTRLSDMSGIELLLLIRERDPNATIFLVGDAYQHEEEIAARSVGPTAYVCKPPHSSWISSLRPEVRAGPSVHPSIESVARGQLQAPNLNEVTPVP
ncbi:MAG: response regulator [Planctomycetales bacterium]|nr:response regulator [Planctomycetales bacterium]